LGFFGFVVFVALGFAEGGGAALALAGIWNEKGGPICGDGPSDIGGWKPGKPYMIGGSGYMKALGGPYMFGGMRWWTGGGPPWN
jgi:hypothetical protein